VVGLGYLNDNDNEQIKALIYKDDPRTFELFQQAGFSHIRDRETE
jgi:hypothetical protein